MNILVINAGSSSVKFSVYNVITGERLYKSEINRLKNIADAIAQIPDIIKSAGIQIDAIGHRVVHGGAAFKDAVIIDRMVVTAIAECVPLAPLHNPPALSGIQIAQQAWPDAPQVAVFDTAFHQTMPEYAYTYAVPEKWREIGVRRYGFHGTSHKYVMGRVAAELQTPASDLRIISCHLGNGASVCGIDHGISIDTSMGMTPLEGLVMGTRSGDVDPGLFNYVHRTLEFSVEQIENALYSESGLAALSGVGNDMRDIETRAAAGDDAAQLAISVYAYRVQKYIGAYAAAMRGVDVIAFTGGIGENSAAMRKRVCEPLGFMGLYFDEDKNTALHLTGFEAASVHLPHSRIKVLVTQTREQWMIAQETARVLDALSKNSFKDAPSFPVAVSARHVHLNQETADRLFGKGYQFQKLHDLSQPGNWAAVETVDVIGPGGKLPHVRILPPWRERNQIEVSVTDSFQLGLHAPVRGSGRLDGTPVVTLRGPAGSVQTDGLIVAQRHIHTPPEDAARLGVHNGDFVEVEIESEGRSIVFRDVLIRVDKNFKLEMHIDTDEANAAHITAKGEGVLRATTSIPRITGYKRMTYHV